jgi:hypothetical protein
MLEHTPHFDRVDVPPASVHGQHNGDVLSYPGVKPHQGLVALFQELALERQP